MALFGGCYLGRGAAALFSRALPRRARPRPDIPPHHLSIISQYCLAELKKQLQAEDFGEEYYDTWLFEDGVSPKPENFEIFNITEKSLIFTFVPYQVAPYAWGTRIVEIPLAAIPEYLDINGPLSILLR
ncbi:MAG TPA: RsiV family protein [Pyrinomonadaceae bacterium]|nr:RsiV family protein [Pyrinomonadaceae bacterium]